MLDRMSAEAREKRDAEAIVKSKSIDETWLDGHTKRLLQPVLVRYSDDQPRGPDGKWIDAGGGDEEPELSKNTVEPLMDVVKDAVGAWSGVMPML